MPLANGTMRLTLSHCMALRVIPTPARYATTPKIIQTAKYPSATVNVIHPRYGSARNLAARRYSSSMGMDEGSIMATIIASHMAVNTRPEMNWLCPGMDIHIMLMVQ